MLCLKTNTAVRSSIRRGDSSESVMRFLQRLRRMSNICLTAFKASTMFSNSEFVVMLNQAASDRDQLAELLNISGEPASAISQMPMPDADLLSTALRLYRLSIGFRTTQNSTSL